MKESILVEQEVSAAMLRGSYHVPMGEFIPIRVMEVEIGQQLNDLSAFDELAGQYYRRALCLIRLHAQPLGIVELTLNEQGISADVFAELVWNALHIPIVKHLQEDGLPEVTKLDRKGLPDHSSIPCLEERNLFLQSAPFVSVIVSTRDRPDHLARCLKSLMSLRYPGYEIIVVDNAPGSTVTRDAIRRTYPNEPKIKYVCENRPGLSLARNSGISVARGEILVFTDDDTIVDYYWLVELVKAFSSADNVACVTSLILPLELETQAQVWFEEFGGFNKGFTRRTFDRASRYTEMPLYPFAAGRFGTGAGMAFTAAFLRSVGGFDPALGAGRKAGGEDLAAFLQVIIKGYTLVYEPASLLYHLHRRGYAELCKQIYNYGIGPTAVLIKIVLEHPLILFELIAKVPYGLFFILSSRSPKNRKRSKDFPKELTALERKGMLCGPFAYVRSRWEARKLSGELALDKTHAVAPARGNN